MKFRRGLVLGLVTLLSASGAYAGDCGCGNTAPVANPCGCGSVAGGGVVGGGAGVMGGAGCATKSATWSEPLWFLHK